MLQIEIEIIEEESKWALWNRKSEVTQAKGDKRETIARSNSLRQIRIDSNSLNKLHLWYVWTAAGFETFLIKRKRLGGNGNLRR